VVCASAHLCIAIDDGVFCESEEDCYNSGQLDASADPTGGPKEWSLTYLDQPTGIACEPQTMTCVGVDSQGTVEVSR
jgi:hypothetical protein